MRLAYKVFLRPVAFSIFWILSFFDSKISRGFQIRKSKPWLRPSPQSDKPKVWFHFSSGEIEYARPVMRLLKNQGFHIIATFFSPTVEKGAANCPDIDFATPTPFDSAREWKSFITLHKPRVLAIARTDTWPEMVWQAQDLGIPSVLFSATLPNTSLRVGSFLGRSLFRSIFESLSQVFCVTPDDLNNFKKISLKIPCEVSGDTRFDQAVFRVNENRPVPELFDPSESVLIIGSSWPEDEEILLGGVKRAIEQGLKVIWAPHEPTKSHLDQLAKQIQSQLNITPRFYSNDSKSGPIVLVDKVGVLADLYKQGRIAFIGGSFKRTIHSVMEASAAGLYTVFGPLHHNNREALALKAVGMAREFKTIKDLEEILLTELEIPEDLFEKRKSKIQNWISSQCGASKKLVSWIQKQI